MAVKKIVIQVYAVGMHHLWSQRIACWSRLQAKAGTREQIPCKCTALNVVESTVSWYNKAYNDGRDLPEKKNPLYKSWKYYKDLSQAELSATPLNTTISLATESKSDEGAYDLFALPKFKTTAKRSTKNQNFFVLNIRWMLWNQKESNAGKGKKQLLQA